MGDKVRISDFSEGERPRERLIKYGGEALSNAELLAILLRTGTKNENIIELCNRILGYCGNLNGLLNITFDELQSINGIKSAKAAQILAIAELSKRFRSYRSGDDIKITSPSDIVQYVMEEMKNLKQEILKVIMLSTKNIVVYEKNVFKGSLNSSIVHPREIYSEALKKNSASIIICHNHPSGDPTPSNEDLNITYRLKECGKILGVELLDHIIIGNGIYTSLKEKGVL